MLSASRGAGATILGAAPAAPGDYDHLGSFSRHAVRMKGVLHMAAQ